MDFTRQPVEVYFSRDKGSVVNTILENKLSLLQFFIVNVESSFLYSRSA